MKPEVKQISAIAGAADTVMRHCLTKGGEVKRGEVVSNKREAAPQQPKKAGK